MTRLTILMGAAAVTVAGGYAALPTPAAAQSNIAEIIVYGNDPCPRSTDDQVVVCARRPEAERYRLPPKYRPSGPPQVSQSWATKSKVLETVGHRHQQLLAGRPGWLHRLPDSSDQAGARG
jgi:hypothetical protein